MIPNSSRISDVKFLLFLCLATAILVAPSAAARSTDAYDGRSGGTTSGRFRIAQDSPPPFVEGDQIRIEPPVVTLDFPQPTAPAGSETSSPSTSDAPPSPRTSFDPVFDPDSLVYVGPTNGGFSNFDLLKDYYIRLNTQGPAAPDEVTPKASRDFANIAVLEDDGTLVVGNADMGFITDTIAIGKRFYETHEDEFDSITIFIGSNFPGPVDIAIE